MGDFFSMVDNQFEELNKEEAFAIQGGVKNSGDMFYEIKMFFVSVYNAVVSK